MFSSEVLGEETSSLFKAGNTILRGSIGVGKTMLLSLFMPEIARAYVQDGRLPAKEGYPALSVGVNFSLAGFTTLGQRALSKDDSSASSTVCRRLRW